MKVSVVATGNRVVSGDVLRLEQESGRWVAYKYGYSRAGVVPFAGMYGASHPSELERFGGMVYCVAEGKVGIAMMCEVIVPTSFSLREIKEACVYNM